MATISPAPAFASKGLFSKLALVNCKAFAFLQHQVTNPDPGNQINRMVAGIEYFQNLFVGNSRAYEWCGNMAHEAYSGKP